MAIADLMADESDRGVVVILGSLIEDRLLDCLMRTFIPLSTAEKKNLTRGGGLLSSFDSRIALAHALGVIEPDTVAMLQVVKAMRNACAHSRQDITFMTPELRAALGLLFHEDNAEEIQDAKSEVALRLMFFIATAFIFTVLDGDGTTAASARAQHILDTAAAEASKALEKHRASLERRKQRRAKHSPPAPTS